MGISVTLSCKELSFRQNDYSVSRGEWRWWYWNCLHILWHFSLKFPPLKYVLASVTDFNWTESEETDFCSVGKPTLSISHYAAKKPRPHTEHLVSALTDRPQLMSHPKASSNCKTCAWTHLQMTGPHLHDIPADADWKRNVLASLTEPCPNTTFWTT